MRILFLTQVFPYPLDAGPKTRAYYVLRYLAQRHEVTLVSFVRSTDTPEALAHVRQYCAAVHTVPIVRSLARNVGFLAESLLVNKPFVITRDRSFAMRKLLGSLLAAGQHFDAVHGDQLWMAPYQQYVRTLCGQAGDALPMRVLDQHNAVYMIFNRLADGERNPLKRQIARLEAKKVARYEAELCTEFERVVWVTREDYDAVAEAANAKVGTGGAGTGGGGTGGGPVVNSGVIPICIDTAQQPPLTRRPQGRRVTFLGGLHYPPNAQGVVWFAQNIFPQVLSAIPDAVLTVIGKQPPSELLDGSIPAANLEVTGYVDDPKPYLADTCAFIVPLLAGGGMRVKILDAWCWGLPIVSTTIGAEGIAATPGEDILLADAPEEFARQVINLLQDPELNAKIAAGGRHSAEQKYEWRNVYKAWDAVYGA
jgi:glycosyltransferase involved in cell wall biosynthesis